MKNVLFRLLSVVFYLVFLGFFIVIFPLHFFLLLSKSKWAHDASHYLNKIWGMVIMYPVGVWIKNENSQVLDPKEVYLFVPNHSSYLDIPICNVSIQHSFRFVGKAELNDIPVFGYMFKRLHISVNRANRKDSYRSYTDSQEKLEEGTSVLLFPEGTIPDKSKVTLLRFKDGAFRMSIENQVKLVPMTIVNADGVFADNGKWMIKPGRVRVIYHEPIDPTGMTLEDMPALKQRVYDLIHSTLVANGGERPEK